MTAAPTTTPILHVDMDAFYASVLIRERPELRDVPVIVGGGHRSVVLAANYPARAFGIHSAMTGTRALRLCPHAVVLAPDYALFSAVSTSVMEVFRRVTPAVEAVSMDEAFLDVSSAVRRLGPPEAIAERLRATVHDEQDITCSVGVAASLSVAKWASRRAKPDGVVVVAPHRIAELLHPCDVGELYGVGDKTRRLLIGAGLPTVGDVARTPVAQLQRHCGEHLGRQLHHLAWGTDRREVAPGSVGFFGHGARSGEGAPDRSMGAQETFGADTDDRSAISRELLRLTATVTRRARAAGVAGATVVLTVRYSDFTTLTRSRTLPEPTDVTREVHATALALYDGLGGRRRVRLVGVRLQGLRPRAAVHRQGVLGERGVGWREADRAVDLASGRFGSAAVRPATLLEGRPGRDPAGGPPPRDGGAGRSRG